MVDITKNIEVINLVKLSLDEDIKQGDPTSESLFPSRSQKGELILILKEDAVVSGLKLFEYVFKKINSEIEFLTDNLDGFTKSGNIGILRGPIKSILKGERTALNFIQRMSGVATETFELSELIRDLPVKISDTRKTIPGWRILDKYSVLVGGGINHRFNLSDQILIKDNHLNNISLTDAVSICRQKFDSLKIEVEVENWDQLKEAIKTDINIIMLDNWNLNDLTEAVKFIRNISDKVEIEISGGITKSNLRKYAEKYPDYISVGHITHSAKAVDFSLELN
ncbi:MAG: nicotinate-nucleotide diphosphorylase (carboxylating) [Chloroflexi bacterium]|nr:nicotinate-nucleotide diphosphorylase (carboxylating) [Chloroflexota bacterium]